MASVRVAVRVRPLNRREKELSAKVIIRMDGCTTYIINTKRIPKGNVINGLKDGKTFSFDFSYDSTDVRRPGFVSQEKVFQDLGSDVLTAAFEGYNACVFAYGQTGSGKSYTMMGNPGDLGLIPQICEGLFCQISAKTQNDGVSFRTEVSYLEIYNERVQDLLKKTSTEHCSLRVREHPKDGPYVEGLSKHSVQSYTDMEELMESGNARRTTASTDMNHVSSRSHAIFTINFTQARFDADLPSETVSKIHLVDLAGSERADATRASGARMKEGANINKSLVTLGSVISALADLSESGRSHQVGKRKVFVPYRDSVLTWLLKDSLGGNSKTIMIATVSPADVNYGETLSTLRYANRAKNIVNSPAVNEDANVRLIRELQAEITRLRGMVGLADQAPHRDPSSSLRAEQRLHQNQAKVLELTKEWSRKWGETQSILKEETLALRKEGGGVVLDSELPHLIGIDDNLLSTGIILYHLREGRTLVGGDETSSNQDEASSNQDIVLHGPGLQTEHCVFESRSGTVTLTPQPGAWCAVNAMAISLPCPLTHGAIIQLGRGTMFRFNHPKEAAELREKRKSLLSSSSPPGSMTDLSASGENLAKVTLLNPGLEQLEKLESQRMNGPAALNAGSRVPRTSLETCMVMKEAIPQTFPVSSPGLESGGGTRQDGPVSTRDGPERRGLSHKSGPAPSAAEAGCARGEAGAGEDRPGEGGGSLQLTAAPVPGRGDGCDGARPAGDANESRGNLADGYEAPPGSEGTSLGSASRPQSVPPPRQAAPGPPEEEVVLEGRFGLAVMDGSRAAAVGVGGRRGSGLGSLVSGLSRMFQEPGRLLRGPPPPPRLPTEDSVWEGSSPSWSSQVVSLMRQSQVLSVVKESQVFSLVRESQVFSLVTESQVFSMVKELPFVQHIRTELLPLETSAGGRRSELGAPAPLQPRPPGPTAAKATEPSPWEQQSLVDEGAWFGGDQRSVGEPTWPPKRQDAASRALEDAAAREHVKEPEEEEPPLTVDHGTENGDPRVGVPAPVLPLESSVTVQEDGHGVPVFCQTLVDFPRALLELQSLPPASLAARLRSALPSSSLFGPQRILALYWLAVAQCSQPLPQPALLVLLESALYVLISDDPASTGPLAVFQRLPLLQLRELHVGFAGQSLRLTGSTEESVLSLHTHSQGLTRELLRGLLRVLCPGDGRVSRYPLLQGDLARLSLDWTARVPDLLLDAGLRVSCQFQKTLADLVYLLHGNMAARSEGPRLGDVRLLLCASVAVSDGPRARLRLPLLTDTHLALMREEPVFRPPRCSLPLAPRLSRFHGVTLRHRSHVRCVLVRHVSETQNGASRLDVILSPAGGGGHPEQTAGPAVSSGRDSNSSPQAEVWKLTFGCSAEAARLINHLSNV